MSGASVNSHDIEDDFRHLVVYVLSCILDSDMKCAMGNGMLTFGSLNEVITIDDLKRFGQNMTRLKAREHSN